MEGPPTHGMLSCHRRGENPSSRRRWRGRRASRRRRRHRRGVATCDGPARRAALSFMQSCFKQAASSSVVDGSSVEAGAVGGRQRPCLLVSAFRGGTPRHSAGSSATAHFLAPFLAAETPPQALPRGHQQSHDGAGVQSARHERVACCGTILFVIRTPRCAGRFFFVTINVAGHLGSHLVATRAATRTHARTAAAMWHRRLSYHRSALGSTRTRGRRPQRGGDGAMTAAIIIFLLKPRTSIFFARLPASGRIRRGQIRGKLGLVDLS